MKGVDNLFGIRIFISYVHKMKNNHQCDEYTLQIVYFFDAFFHLRKLGLKKEGERK